jgi:hypothetical protein
MSEDEEIEDQASSEEEEQILPKSKKKIGKESRERKAKASMVWSRIVSMDVKPQKNNASFPVQVDLALVEGKEDYRAGLSVKQFRPYFDPKEYVKLNEPLEMQKHQLREQQLTAYAKKASEIREWFMTKAKEVDDE